MTSPNKITSVNVYIYLIINLRFYCIIFLENFKRNNTYNNQTAFLLTTSAKKTKRCDDQDNRTKHAECYGEPGCEVADVETSERQLLQQGFDLVVNDLNVHLHQNTQDQQGKTEELKVVNSNLWFLFYLLERVMRNKSCTE